MNRHHRDAAPSRDSVGFNHAPQPTPRSAFVTEATANLVAGRNCDSCYMCCKLFEIPALAKPEGVWCTNCNLASGCTIYEARPQECRDFFCHYRLDKDVPEHWKPNRSHMVLRATGDGVRIVAYVDPKRPMAWRGDPYYRDLKAWAANRLQADKQVHVRIGARTIVVLPDRDVDLGDVGDKVILTRKSWTAQGPRFDFEVLARDDPRAKAGAAPGIGLPQR